MQLIYRGNIYDDRLAHRLLQPPSPGRQLIYRGNIYWIDPVLTKAPVKSAASVYELIYRGSRYQVDRNQNGETTAIAVSTLKRRTLVADQPAIQHV
jgi:hypothetical protein